MLKKTNEDLQTFLRAASFEGDRAHNQIPQICKSLLGQGMSYDQIPCLFLMDCADAAKREDNGKTRINIANLLSGDNSSSFYHVIRSPLLKQKADFTFSLLQHGQSSVLHYLSQFACVPLFMLLEHPQQAQPSLKAKGELVLNSFEQYAFAFAQYALNCAKFAQRLSSKRNENGDFFTVPNVLPQRGLFATTTEFMLRISAYGRLLQSYLEYHLKTVAAFKVSATATALPSDVADHWNEAQFFFATMTSVLLQTHSEVALHANDAIQQLVPRVLTWEGAVPVPVDSTRSVLPIITPFDCTPTVQSNNGGEGICTQQQLLGVTLLLRSLLFPIAGAERICDEFLGRFTPPLFEFLRIQLASSPLFTKSKGCCNVDQICDLWLTMMTPWAVPGKSGAGKWSSLQARTKHVTDNYLLYSVLLLAFLSRVHHKGWLFLPQNESGAKSRAATCRKALRLLIKVLTVFKDPAVREGLAHGDTMISEHLHQQQQQESVLRTPASSRGFFGPGSPGSARKIPLELQRLHKLFETLAVVPCSVPLRSSALRDVADALRMALPVRVGEPVSKLSKWLDWLPEVEEEVKLAIKARGVLSEVFSLSSECGAVGGSATHSVWSGEAAPRSRQAQKDKWRRVLEGEDRGTEQEIIIGDSLFQPYRWMEWKWAAKILVKASLWINMRLGIVTAEQLQIVEKYQWLRNAGDISRAEWREVMRATMAMRLNGRVSLRPLADLRVLALLLIVGCFLFPVLAALFW